MTNLKLVIDDIKSISNEVLELKIELQDIHSSVVCEKITVNGTKNRYERAVYESGEHKNDKTRDWALKDLLADDLCYLESVRKVERFELEVIQKENLISEKKIALEYLRNILKLAEIESSKVGI